MEREPTPEGAAVHRIADQRTLNGLPRQQCRTIDRTMSSTCQIHGAKGFCNLRVTKAGGGLVLDPHVAGGCVITLDEAGAAALRDLLIEWLGWKDRR